MAVTPENAPYVRLALRMGYMQHVIAAFFDDNQGRVSETNTGKRHLGAPVADHLPPGFPPLSRKRR